MKEKVKGLELAGVIGISDRQVYKLAQKGIFQKSKGGVYNLSDSVQAYIAFKLNELRGNTGSLTEERTRLTKLQADKVAFELSVSRGEHIPLALCVKTWQSMAAAARTRILSIPSAVKSKSPHIENDTIDSIDMIIREVLKDISETGIPAKLRKRVELDSGGMGASAEDDAE